ncbi:hypothetical protein [Bdellovibrio bacteriovorus]|uniref:hypothetical protein n=1 Tax=Bdellovibrio TaxID=958 RepID=UPI0035A907A4
MNFKSPKGFSVVEGIIAAGVVALSVLAVGTIVGQHSRLTKSAQAKQEMPGISTDVLNRTRSLLLDTQDTATQLKTKGLCALLEPREIKPGIIPVELVVDRVADAYTQEKWATVFAPEWKLEAFSVTGSGGIQFSLAAVEGKNVLLSSRAIDSQSLRVYMNASIRTLDPGAEDVLFSEISSNTKRIDAKKVVFMLEAVTKYDKILENGVRQEVKTDSKDLVSILDVGSCDIKDASGKALILSPAGTGIGDPSGRTIFNNTEFKDIGVAAFEITMSAMEVVQGKYINGRLSADRTKNVVSACTETRYRCPKTKEERSYRSFINLIADVNYHARNMYGYRERARVIPKLEFADANGNDYLSRYNASVNYTVSASVNYRQHSDQLYYPVNSGGGLDLTAPMSFGEGNNRILASVNNAEPLCRQVCSVTKPTTLKPELKMSTPDLLNTDGKPVSEVGSASMPLHCTMCFMKSCTRMGLETFGPVTEMPPEPLDAQIPECAAQDDMEAKKILPFAEQNINTSIASSCISAKVVDGKLVYRTRDCNDSLPVMCFAFGEYTLATPLGVSTPRVEKYSMASRACRDLGRESHATETLRLGILQQGGSIANIDKIPSSNGRYAFLNLSKAGSFIAPQSEEEKLRAVVDLQKEFGTAQVQSEFWVALKMEMGGVVADIPVASTSNNADEQHLVYYSPAGVQTHDMVTTTPYSFVEPPTGASDTAFVLFNHVKFRGVVPVSRQQETAFEFLCQKKTDKSFFVTAGKANRSFDVGGSACESQGGLFAAPHSPTAWLQALLKVQAHGNYAPFPELTANPPNRVWVALEGALSPALQGEFKKLSYRKTTGEELSASLVDRDGSFIEQRKIQMQVEVKSSVEESTPTGTSTNTTTKTEPVYEWVANPDVKIKVACYSGKRKNIVVNSQSSGCASDEIRLKESDLKKSIISLIWVLEKENFDLGPLDFIKVD